MVPSLPPIDGSESKIPEGGGVAQRGNAVPESEEPNERQVLADALVAVRRAASCRSIADHSADALRATAELLELLAPSRSLRAASSGPTEAQSVVPRPRGEGRQHPLLQ